MTIRVVYYGEIADVTGKETEELSNMTTVHEVYHYLEKNFPELKSKAFKIMVNDTLINHEQNLKDGDEVIILAPHIE